MFKCTVPIVLFLDKLSYSCFYIYIIFTGSELHIDNLIITLLNLKMYWKRLITSKSISGTVLGSAEFLLMSFHHHNTLVKQPRKAMHSRGRHNNDQTCTYNY